jgi:hypothetical protein
MKIRKKRLSVLSTYNDLWTDDQIFVKWNTRKFYTTLQTRPNFG